MHHGLSTTGTGETVGPEAKVGSKKPVAGSRKKDSCASEDSSASDAVRSVEGDKGETKTGKKRSATKGELIAWTWCKVCVFHDIVSYVIVIFSFV